MRKSICLSAVLIAVSAPAFAGGALQVSDLQSMKAGSIPSLGSQVLPRAGYGHNPEEEKTIAENDFRRLAGRYSGTMPGSGRPCSIRITSESSYGRSHWAIEAAYPANGRTAASTLLYHTAEQGGQNPELEACGKSVSYSGPVKMAVLDAVKARSTDYNVKLVDISMANGAPESFRYYEQSPDGKGRACAALIKRLAANEPSFICSGLKKEPLSSGGYSWSGGGNSASGPWDTDDGMGGIRPDGGLNDTDDGMGGSGPNGGYGGGYGPDGSGGGVDF